MPFSICDSLSWWLLTRMVVYFLRNALTCRIQFKLILSSPFLLLVFVCLLWNSEIDVRTTFCAAMLIFLNNLLKHLVSTVFFCWKNLVCFISRISNWIWRFFKHHLDFFLQNLDLSLQLEKVWTNLSLLQKHF